MATQKKPNLNVGKDAPLWMQHVSSILIILLAAKPVLIYTMPGLEEAHKSMAGLWFDWMANVIAVLFAIIMVFSKKNRV